MPLNLPDINASMYADTERSLIERVARLSADLESEGTLHSGRPADVLIALSETVDLLVIGSRGYGPLRAVLLGGVSGQVTRSAACPVVVVPPQATSAVRSGVRVGGLTGEWSQRSGTRTACCGTDSATMSTSVSGRWLSWYANIRS
jgi:hypothetical protein